MHEIYYSFSYNIRTSNGALFTLSDIIKPDAFDLLSQFCANEILNMFQANSLVEAGLFKNKLIIKEDQDFYLTPNALVLWFDPYETAPYSSGSIEVQLRFEKIKSLLREDFPFHK